jgi:hypothetical protein
MTTMGTPCLPVRQISLSGGSGTTPRRITFVFNTPYLAYMFQQTLTITENPLVSGYHGKLTQGSSQHPAVSGITAGSDVFGPLWTFVNTYTRFCCTITYDDTTLNVSDVELTATLAVVNIDSVQMALASLANVDIGAGIDSLNRIANALSPPQGLAQMMDSASLASSGHLTMGSVHISAGIESLNRIAHALTQGLQRLAPMMDSAPPPPPSGNGATEPM